MKSLRTTEFRRAILASAAAFALLPNLAYAQSTAANEAEDESSEIVVTGTLLRNSAPVGSSAITVGSQKFEEQGATTSNELLATIPQVSNLFNSVPSSRLSVATNQIQVVRPNLRNLSPETGSSSSTLVLFDGHRIAGVGVTQSAVDPDLIPSVAIERVEVVTDGGSATYGADAVGGVINFITRKRFDGVKVSGRYGFADDYQQVEASGIIGKDWGSGSIFAAYTYQHNDSLYGGDRDWIQQRDFVTGIPTGRSCTPGNVQVGSTFYALPGLTSNTPNACDSTDANTFVPTSTRHGALAGLHQELSSWLTADLRAFYGERTSTSLAPFRGTVTVTGGSSASNPLQAYYRPVTTGSTSNQTVYFDFAPLLGGSTARSVAGFSEWGTNAEFTAKLDDNWQLRTLINYSSSKSFYKNEGLNQTLLSAAGRGTTTATAVNFYNPSAGDLPLIQQITNSEIAGEGRDSQFNLRAIVDGSLFSLPGGEVKLAAGYEYLDDDFSQRIAPANSAIGAVNNVAWTPYSRKVNSAFGEIQIPIVGEGNRGFIYSLTLAGSVRYDHFSDFGSSTNPKIGVTLKPVSWMGLRGNYSTSFNAPGAVDQLGSLRNAISFFPFNAFVNPAHTGANAPTAVGTVALQGSNPGLIPQEAKTYSFGFDIDPPFIPGLHASVNYYNVKFKNLIGIPTPNAGIYATFPNNVQASPGGVTVAQLQAFRSGAPNGASVIDPLIAARCATPTVTTSTCNVYSLVDFRVGNYGSLRTDGIDFTVNYSMPTSFGSIDAGVSGNYVLNRKSQISATSPIVDQLAPGQIGGGRMQMQATLGATVGAFRAQATMNHTSGYALLRNAATLPQDKVGAFDTVNLFFKYEVPSDSGMFKDLEFTLNVNNVFDTDPPLYQLNTGNGFANGFTLGRLVQFGISKKF